MKGIVFFLLKQHWTKLTIFGPCWYIVNIWSQLCGLKNEQYLFYEVVFEWHKEDAFSQGLVDTSLNTKVNINYVWLKLRFGKYSI